MTFVLADRVRDSTLSTGTGAVTLQNLPPNGYQALGSVLSNNDTAPYCIADAVGSNWEVGIGTYSTTGPTLTRTTVIASSNAGAAVNFSSGQKDVFIAPLAALVAKTVAKVTSSNSPYTAKITDDLVEFFEDATNDPSGAALALVMCATPYPGLKLTAVWWTTQAGAAPPTITGNGGFGVEDINNPGTVLAAGTKTSINSWPNRATWEFDGTQWVLRPGS